MFKNLFGKSELREPQRMATMPVARHGDLGMRYSLPNVTAVDWLAKPFDFGEAADLGARLAALSSEGFGVQEGAEILLTWPAVYAVLSHPDLRSFREALQIPPETAARPRLTSRAALGDPEFLILLDDWVDGQGRPLTPRPRLNGRVLEHGAGPLVGAGASPPDARGARALSFHGARRAYAGIQGTVLRTDSPFGGRRWLPCRPTMWPEPLC